MYVAASTACFPDLSYLDSVQLLSDLEFANIEVAMHEDGTQLKPSVISQDVAQAVRDIRDSHRLDIASFDLRIAATGDDHYQQFDGICKIAKATKVVTITVPSGELGTPFNEEVNHLQRLVEIAENEGVRVAMKSQIGRLSEDPDTVKVLCDNVHGLGLTLDPSHYLCGPYSKKNLDKLMEYVFHVHLRDSKSDQLQVRVGQGVIDYGKIISQLQRVGYDLALSVEMTPAEDIEMRQELRKLRLLLDSLL